MSVNMHEHNLISGYLDVKISARTRRGFTPWKAWQKQWCEIKKLDTIEHGVELKLKSCEDGTLLSVLSLPRSAKICRTESRTKQYSFGVFTLGKNHKALLYLSGSSETDTQTWISFIRKMLSIALYLPVGDRNFHVSLVDNTHSRDAGLMGLYGVLRTTPQEIIVSDPCTGEPRITWKWYQFHQFHLQASTLDVDKNKIVVIHTSSEFISGAGQLYLYSDAAPRLLRHLVARGNQNSNSKITRDGPINTGTMIASPSVSSSSFSFIAARRLSRSDGDLCVVSTSDLYSTNGTGAFIGATVKCGRDGILTAGTGSEGSDDSGVRVSIASDDFVLKSKIASSLISIGLALLSKTPGGSETSDSLMELNTLRESEAPLARRESGISLASGVYEEINDDETNSHQKSKSSKSDDDKISHVYEDPDLISLSIDQSSTMVVKPPPLPPRQNDMIKDRINEFFKSSIGYKQRCSTLPAKDRQRMSQIFSGDSEYIVMSPSKKQLDVANHEYATYLPMHPITQIKTKLENYYMAMNGSTSKK